MNGLLACANPSSVLVFWVLVRWVDMAMLVAS